MAKLLIASDEYIFRNNGQYFFKSQEWQDFYWRYLRVFEELRIATRVIEEPDLKQGRVLVDDPRIEILPIPLFHGPSQYAKTYFSVGKAMKDAVRGCDAAVLRLPSTVAQRISKQVLKSGMPFATEIVFAACDGAETSNTWLEKTIWRIIDRKMRNICAKADGVSCVTEKYLQKRYFSVKPGHFESYYSTLNLDKGFFTAPRRYPNKDVFTIAHIDLQIGLHSRKGTDMIIKALARLKKEQGITVNVKFAGDDWDNSTEKIMNFAKALGIEEQVECVGLLSRSEVNSFLDNADLFVLPTKAEGLPRVIIEAIAKGLPTITTPVSGNPELISDDYLVPINDVETLAIKIGRLVSDKEEYERVSKINYEHSLQYMGSSLQGRRDEFYGQLKIRVK